MFDGFDREQAPHANHGGASVEDLLLGGERADRSGLGVGLVRDERAKDDASDGHEHGDGGVRKLLRHGFRGGELRGGGGDEGDHGESSVHQLGAGHGASHVTFRRGERERLLKGVIDGGIRGGARGPRGQHTGNRGGAVRLFSVPRGDVLLLGAAFRVAVLVGEENHGFIADGLVGGEPARLGYDRAAGGGRRGRGDAGGEGSGDGEGGHGDGAD